MIKDASMNKKNNKSLSKIKPKSSYEIIEYLLDKEIKIEKVK